MPERSQALATLTRARRSAQAATPQGSFGSVLNMSGLLSLFETRGIVHDYPNQRRPEPDQDSQSREPRLSTLVVPPGNDRNVNVPPECGDKYEYELHPSSYL